MCCCWATDTLAAHATCETAPLVPYTVKTVYLLLPFVSYPLANYLSIETLAPYLMTAMFFQKPLVRDLLPFQIKADNTRISPWLLCRAAVICEMQLLLREITLTLLQHNIFIFVFTNPVPLLLFPPNGLLGCLFHIWVPLQVMGEYCPVLAIWCSAFCWFILSYWHWKLFQLL